MKWKKGNSAADVALNMAAGTVAGLAGSWTMNRFQEGIASFQKNGAPNQHHGQKAEPATAKTAKKLWRAFTGRGLNARQKQRAEPWVHYGFGAITGAAYGALATAYPESEAGAGTVYGSAVWLLADEIGVPAAGLAQRPDQIPVSTHLMALASHLVYGLTLFGVSRAIRKAV